MSYYPKNVKDLDQDEYDELLQEVKLLNRLREAGVDNWEGYSYAFEDDDGLDHGDNDWDD